MLRSIFAAMLLLSTLAEALAGGRVALVVGVSNYAHGGRLANTLNDANDMAATLKRLGFDVQLILDPNRSALEAAVRRYGDRSVDADVSLFYFSGHALEASTHNWLLPTSANPASERELRFEAVDLNTVQEQTDGAAKVSIIFLDACRDNPFARMVTRRGAPPRGLAGIDVSPGGILVAFSTGPGQVALDSIGGMRNSPFTAALLKHIETPGLEIESLLTRVTKDVFDDTKGKQRPWQNSSLEGDFYFVPPLVAAGAPAAQPHVTLDTTFWESIKASQNPADFEAYLARFPNGVFAELAQNRLALLKQYAAANPAVPPRALPPVAPSPSVPPQDRSETASMVERARSLIASGDILSARLILRRAFERGDARAALELGGTYDPLVLRRLNVIVNGSWADTGQAHDWYMKAAELGSIDAINRINQLNLQNR